MVLNVNLKDLKLKAAYNSEWDDILNDFYIPCLSVSSTYKRMSGYFSSATFALAASGVANFIMNGGSMEFIIGVSLSKEDFDAIMTGLKNPEKVVAEIIINDLNSLEDEMRKNYIKMLAWMVAKKTLELKIAITEKGMFHQKVGILQDAEGNSISFSGSDNETAAGWMLNVEEFKVFRSWNEDEIKYLHADVSSFGKFWNKETKRTKIIDLPDAVKEKLIEIAPQSKKEFESIVAFVNSRAKQNKKAKELRPYQETAINKWEKSGYRGIFEMATGTGKTYTAINCIKRLLSKKKERLSIVITCPYTHLVEQWIKELQGEGLEGVPVYGSSAAWQSDIERKMADLRLAYRDYVILVTTYDTFATPVFRDMLKNTSVFLIADEMHSSGSEERVDYLSDEYEFRLGLSATPSRWLDQIGTNRILSYFGGVIFTFDLKEAIDKHFLVPYEYYPHLVELTGGELGEYVRITKRIAMAAAKSPSADRDKQIKLLLIKRRNIIKNAIMKFGEFDRLIATMKDINHVLVYCSDKQIDEIMDTLRKKAMPFHRFTHEENGKERSKILEKFTTGEYKMIVAIKCLDEGVDVPSTETAIILASSGNPKEFIQRRGRILRLSPETGKKKATIHDIIVVPPKEVIEFGNPKLEKDILRRELERYEEFAHAAMNPLHSTNIIIDLVNRYKL
jgi:superfamily II DNA or RNA helicase